MMVDKIRHEGAEGKDLKFFKSLPPEVLKEVRDLSPEAQEAFDQNYGLIPLPPKK